MIQSAQTNIRKEVKRVAQKIISMHTTRHYPNDTLTVVLEEEGLPIDQITFPRRGNVVKVQGQWMTHEQAVAHAKTKLTGEAK